MGGREAKFRKQIAARRVAAPPRESVAPIAAPRPSVPEPRVSAPTAKPASVFPRFQAEHIPGEYLRDVKKNVEELYEGQPLSERYDRDYIAQTIAITPEEAPRVQTALDALNQLEAIKMPVTQVERFSVVNFEDGKTVYQFKKVSPEKAASERRADQRERRRQQEEETKKRERERESIDSVVIDKGLEIGEASLKADVVRIQLDENGKAVVLYKSFGDYVKVDRKTGSYKRFEGSILDYALREDVMHFYDHKARELEGEEVGEYSPRAVKQEVLEDTYHRAVESKILDIQRWSGNEVQFFYQGFGGFIGPRYGQVVLDENKVVEDIGGFIPKERPLNSQFGEFLKQKKAELEGKAPAEPMWPEARGEEIDVVAVGDEWDNRYTVVGRRRGFWPGGSNPTPKEVRAFYDKALKAGVLREIVNPDGITVGFERKDGLYLSIDDDYLPIDSQTGETPAGTIESFPSHVTPDLLAVMQEKMREKPKAAESVDPEQARRQELIAESKRFLEESGAIDMLRAKAEGLEDIEFTVTEVPEGETIQSFHTRLAGVRIQGPERDGGASSIRVGFTNEWNRIAELYRMAVEVAAVPALDGEFSLKVGLYKNRTKNTINSQGAVIDSYNFEVEHGRQVFSSAIEEYSAEDIDKAVDDFIQEAGFNKKEVPAEPAEPTAEELQAAYEQYAKNYASGAIRYLQLTDGEVIFQARAGRDYTGIDLERGVIAADGTGRFEEKSLSPAMVHVLKAQKERLENNYPGSRIVIVDDLNSL